MSSLLLVLSSVTPTTTTTTTTTVDPASCAIRLLTMRIILEDVLLLLLVLYSPFGGCSLSKRVVGFGLLRDRWCYLFVAASASGVVVAVDPHPVVVVPENSNNRYT